MSANTFYTEVYPLRDKIYRFSYSLLKVSEDAEDATQEILLKLWKNKKKLFTYRNVEAVAMTMTKNHCLDRLRLKANQTAELKIVVEDDADLPDKKAEIRDAARKVLDLMEDLTEQQRQIVMLRDVEQYEYEEIAEVTGLEINTIRVNLSRARKKLREGLLKTNAYGLE
ncbi:MAG: RNA polymerase sigma factor [Flavobacteriales bacterium]|nr:RNA polymerase sigma factor [Flavobacteriales bacterium]